MAPDLVAERHMGVADYVDALEREGRLLVECSKATDLDALVPTCPGWHLSDLLAHIGFVHRWAATYVADGLTEMVEEPDEAAILDAAPERGELADWVEEGHAALVRVLSSAPADQRCWTFLDAPSPLDMWARRQAHETAIHRVDVELAARRPVTAFGPDFAVDGIEELLFGFLSRRRSRHDHEEASWTFGLVPTDRADRWTVTVLPDAAYVTSELKSPDVLVHASAADLYLVLWHRPPYGRLQSTGRVDLLEAWNDRFQIKWS